MYDLLPPSSLPPPQNLYPSMRKGKFISRQPTARARMTRQPQDQERKERRKGLHFCFDNTALSKTQHTVVLSSGQSDCKPALPGKTGEQVRSQAKRPEVPSLSLSKGEIKNNLLPDRRKHAANSRIF